MTDPEDLAEEVWNTGFARAKELVVFGLQIEGLDGIDENEWELVELGISAGLTALAEELSNRGMLVLP